jgi:hypothetical protein
VERCSGAHGICYVVLLHGVSLLEHPFIRFIKGLRPGARSSILFASTHTPSLSGKLMKRENRLWGAYRLANLQFAEAFIRQHGNPVELARLEYILYGTPAPDTAIAQLRGRQNPDGSWSPFWAPAAGSVDATCYILAQAEQLGVAADESWIGRALDFLLQHQTEEGYFEEDAALADCAPPWAAPGQLDARLYLTANAAFWLAHYGQSGLTDPSILSNRTSLCVQRAAQSVASFVDRSGRLPSFLHTNWLMAGVWLTLGQSDHAQRTIGFLQNQLANMDAANLAWLTNALIMGGQPIDSGIIRLTVSKLSDLQHADGHWSGEMGENQDVHTTLESLRVIQLCQKQSKLIQSGGVER